MSYDCFQVVPCLSIVALHHKDCGLDAIAVTGMLAMPCEQNSGM